MLQGKLESFEESYYKRLSQKLSSVSTNSKCYWFLLKRIQKKKLNEKKIPVIPPLFYNNNAISNSKEKTEVFDEHFSKQFFDTK